MAPARALDHVRALCAVLAVVWLFPHLISPYAATARLD